MNWFVLSIVFIVITFLLVAGILLTWFLYVEPRVVHYKPSLENQKNENAPPDLKYSKLEADEIIHEKSYELKKEVPFKIKRNVDGSYEISNEEDEENENNPYYNFSRGKVVLKFKTQEHHIESPFQEYGSMFGCSSSLDKDLLFVGAKNHGLLSEGAAVLLKFNKLTKEYGIEKILASPNHQADSYYGYKVLIARPYLLVGAPYEKNGFIYIYLYEEGKFPLLIASLTTNKTSKFGLDFIVEKIEKNSIDLIALGFSDNKASFLKKSICLEKNQEYYDNFDIEEIAEFD